MTSLDPADASSALPDWRYLQGRMHLTVDTGSFPASMAFVNEVASIADQHNHHPEIDIRYATVHLAMASHDVDAITDRDIRVGTAISRVIAEQGLTVRGSRGSEFEIAIDAMDIARVRGFWQAVTGYRDDVPDELSDPNRIGPTLWFQQMREPRPQRNRIHLDLVVAPEEVAPRMAAALAAGGKLVSDRHAPTFWVLADPEGNEVCLCTWQHYAADNGAAGWGD